MTQMTIGYSDSEDRLWLLLSDDETQFWLSRRFCAGLIRYLEQLLTASCPTSALSSQLDAKTRVAIEHQTAQDILADQRSGAAGKAAAPESAPTLGQRRSELITSVNLTARADKVEVELNTPGHSRLLHLTRAEAHLFLSALWQRGKGANWNLSGPEWIE